MFATERAAVAAVGLWLIHIYKVNVSFTEGNLGTIAVIYKAVTGKPLVAAPAPAPAAPGPAAYLSEYRLCVCFCVFSLSISTPNRASIQDCR